MRELSVNEVERVSGSWNDWQTGDFAIFDMSLYSPVTAYFGIPIGATMFALGSIYSYW